MFLVAAFVATFNSAYIVAGVEPSGFAQLISSYSVPLNGISRFVEIVLCVACGRQSRQCNVFPRGAWERGGYKSNVIDGRFRVFITSDL